MNEALVTSSLRIGPRSNSRVGRRVTPVGPPSRERGFYVRRRSAQLGSLAALLLISTIFVAGPAAADITPAGSCVGTGRWDNGQSLDAANLDSVQVFPLEAFVTWQGAVPNVSPPTRGPSDRRFYFRRLPVPDPEHPGG